MGSQEGITSLSYNWSLLGQEQMRNLSHSKQNDVPRKERPLVEFPFFGRLLFSKVSKILLSKVVKVDVHPRLQDSFQLTVGQLKQQSLSITKKLKV